MPKRIPKIKVDQEDLFKGIWSDTTNRFHLPRNLYFQTANLLKKSVYKGFGSPLTEIKFGTPDHKLLSRLRENIYMFSAAKTFQQVDAMVKLKEASESLVKDGRMATFKEFRESAHEIFDTYNENYLKTEYNTAQLQARNAEKWSRIQQNKDLFPLLRYSAISSSPCDICGPLNGIVKRADDPFWDEFYPENHFNCMCIVEQGDEDDFGEPHEDTEAIEDTVGSNMDDVFLMNTGKDGVIFRDEGPDKHPYFDVEKNYQNLASNNFNLPIPDND